MFVCVWWWVKKMVVGWVVRSVPGMCVLASSVCKDFVHASVKTHTHTHTLVCLLHFLLEQIGRGGNVFGDTQEF